MRRAPQISWYHITRSVALVLIFFALTIEDNASNRATYITAAIGLMAAEPVGRRDKRSQGNGSTK